MLKGKKRIGTEEWGFRLPVSFPFFLRKFVFWTRPWEAPPVKLQLMQVTLSVVLDFWTPRPWDGMLVFVLVPADCPHTVIYPSHISKRRFVFDVTACTQRCVDIRVYLGRVAAESDWWALPRPHYNLTVQRHACFCEFCVAIICGPTVMDSFEPDLL